VAFEIGQSVDDGLHIAGFEGFWVHDAGYVNKCAAARWAPVAQLRPVSAEMI
jgi:hypothetical protein